MANCHCVAMKHSILITFCVLFVGKDKARLYAMFLKQKLGQMEPEKIKLSTSLPRESDNF